MFECDVTSEMEKLLQINILSEEILSSPLVCNRLFEGSVQGYVNMALYK